MDIIKAIFIAGLATGVVSYLLVFFAIKRGYVELDESVDELKKRKKLAKKNKTEFQVNPLHRKWLYFGGGYYGMMALATYVHVEVLEIIDFFAAYTSFTDLINNISIGAIFGLIIDSFMNLIPAFTWFLYWPKMIVMSNAWIWLGASYAGYRAGDLLARHLISRKEID